MSRPRRRGTVAALAGVAAAAALAGCGGGAAASSSPLVLSVRVPTAAQRSGEAATAFALGDGRAITVAHVLRARHPVFVGDRRARVLLVDRRLDIALVAVAGLRGPAPSQAAARAGERVSVRVIRPGGGTSLRATVRRTICARVGRPGGSPDVRPALELAAAVMPGDSGAPVLDARGRVIGVLFAQASDGAGLAYALDARALARLTRPGARAAS